MKIKSACVFAFVLSLLPGFTFSQDSGWVWRTFSCPDFHFSIQSPVSLDRTDLKDPKTLFVGANRLKHDKPRFYMCIFACPIAHAPFGYNADHPVKLEEIPDKMMNVLVEIKVMSDFVTRTTYGSNQGAKTAFTKGTCKDQKGILRNFTMLNLRKGSYFWSIDLEYENNDPIMEKMAGYTIKSFQFIH
jgi:hypothetical protein